MQNLIGIKLRLCTKLQANLHFHTISRTPRGTQSVLSGAKVNPEKLAILARPRKYYQYYICPQNTSLMFGENWPWLARS